LISIRKGTRAKMAEREAEKDESRVSGTIETKEFDLVSRNLTRSETNARELDSRVAVDRKWSSAVSRGIKGRKIAELFRVPRPSLSIREIAFEKKRGTSRGRKREMEEGWFIRFFPDYLLFHACPPLLTRHPCLLPFGHKYVNTGYGRLGQALRIRRARRGIIYDNFLDTNSSESCNNESREEENEEGKIFRRRKDTRQERNRGLRLI